MPERNYTLWSAMAFSVLFHLSMITIFSIVIIVPAETPVYYPFDIVDPRTNEPVFGAARSTLQLRSASQLFDAAAAADGEAQEGFAPETISMPSLPEISAPTLEFAAFRAPGARGLELRADFDEVEAAAPGEAMDSWTRFGKSVGALRTVVSRLASELIEDELDPGGAADETSMSPSTRPAPGFEARIRWNQRSPERELLYAPPIAALWGVNASALEAPLTLNFSISPEGQVIDVIAPLTDASGLAPEIAEDLKKYRFEPLLTGESRPQRGDFVVQAAPEQP